METHGVITPSFRIAISLTSEDYELLVEHEELKSNPAIFLPVKRTVGEWLEYDPSNKTNISCAKYLVCRSDGKIHFESFNGTGWAYNDKVIKYYALLNSPITNEK